jgi:hypothetical protein
MHENLRLQSRIVRTRALFRKVHTANRQNSYCSVPQIGRILASPGLNLTFGHVSAIGLMLLYMNNHSPNFMAVAVSVVKASIGLTSVNTSGTQWMNIVSSFRQEETDKVTI